MDIEATKKPDTAKSGVNIRLLLPVRTHKKLTAYNLKQPRETVAKSAIALIEKALTI